MTLQQSLPMILLCSILAGVPALQAAPIQQDVANKQRATTARGLSTERLPPPAQANPFVSNNIKLPPLPPAARPGDKRVYGSVRDPAFQSIIKKSFPLSPEQIQALREVFQTMQRASVAPVEVPTPTVSTRIVPLAPGTTPPVIKMATGYVSSIVFLDETGQPWPLSNVSVGNPQAFKVDWNKENNILMIQGIGAYDTGNMAVRLRGMNTPVMLTMVNDQKQVDYRVDMRVQGRGPNAKAMMMSDSNPGKASRVLMDLLDGIPPAGAQALSVKGAQAKAWLRDGNLYLRTNLLVLSPSWNQKMSSADGTQVYEMVATPMILASNQGKTVQLKIGGL